MATKGMADLEWLRTQFILALAESATLRSLLVLKGGAAVALVHRVGMRASTGLDYSIAGDAENPSELGERIFAALRSRLEPQGLVVFDASFVARPESAVSDPTWGGYAALFKLIERKHFDALAGNIERIRRQALSVTGGLQATRTFRVEISKFEHCEPNVVMLIAEGISCRVYSRELLVAEKLRALCQQMPEYTPRRHPAPRARDYYDLHALLTEGGIDLADEDMHDLVRVVFGAKSVEVELLTRLDSHRDFHASDWPAVQNTIPAGRPAEFDFYVDFVVAEVRKLSKPLRMKDAP